MPYTIGQAIRRVLSREARWYLTWKSRKKLYFTALLKRILSARNSFFGVCVRGSSFPLMFVEHLKKNMFSVFTRAKERKIFHVSSGFGFRGGGTPLPQRFDLCWPKGSPFCSILRFPFLAGWPLDFLKAPSPPIYTNFEGGARTKKKRQFWS